MNEKENYEKIFKFFESLQTQLMNESVGFEICKTIDLNERINFMDYENELLIYGINYRSSLLKSAPLNDSKVNVRGLGIKEITSTLSAPSKLFSGKVNEYMSPT